MRDIRNEVGILSESMGGLAGLGRTLTYTVTAPAIAFGTMAVQQASEFDAAMRNINSIVGMSEDQLGALTEQVLDFGKTTRGGVTESASALYTVFSAGILDTAEAFNIMQASVRTAEAGLADLETTTGAIVATQLAFNDTSAEMTDRVSNALTRMVQVGVGSMDEFAHAIAGVTPSASMLGMSVEELFGDMAFLTQRGQSAANAATNLNNALTSLAKPTEAMSAAMHELGANGAEELIEQFGGVNGAFQALIGTTNGTQEEIQALFNNIRGARAINVFAQDIDGWNATMLEFNNSLEGSTMRAWEEQGKSFASHWDLMQSALGAAAITIGSQLVPVLIPLIDGITNLVLGFTELDPSVIQFGMAAVGAVAAAAPLLWLVGGLAAAISPIGIAFTLAAVAIASNWETIASVVIAGATEIQQTLAPLTEFMNDFWDDMFPPDVVMPMPEVALAGEPTVIDPMSLITVDTTKSLWQIFTEQGYDEYFSWQEFMRLAEEGGWTGGAVEVGAEITIDMSTVRTLPPPEPLLYVDGHSITVDEDDIATTVDTGIASALSSVDWDGMFDDLEFDYAASGLGDLFTGVVSFGESMMSADWSGMAALGAELISISNILIGGAASGLGDVLTGLGNGIESLVNAVADLVAGDIEGAFANLGAAVIGLGSGAFLTIVDTVGIFVDALAELFNLDIPSFSEFADGLREEANAAVDSLQMSTDQAPRTVSIPITPDLDIVMTDTSLNSLMTDGLSTAFGEITQVETTDWWGNRSFTLDVTVPADINWTPEAVTLALDAAQVAANTDLSLAEQQAAQALISSWSTAMSPEDRAAFEEVLATYYSGGGVIVTPDGMTITINPDGSIVTIADTMGGSGNLGTGLTVPSVSLQATQAMVTANGWAIIPPPVGTVVPMTSEEPVLVEAPIEVDTTTIATNFAEGFGAGMDAETIVATYLAPIETKWNEMFAPEGMMSLNLTGFVEHMTTQAILIDAQAFILETTFSDMAASVGASMAAVSSYINHSISNLEGRMGGAVQGVLKLQSVISNLMNMEGIMEIYLNIGSTGVSTDGSHADGLANVPYDGYIAELHAGERVMTAEENQAYQYDQMSAGAILGQTSQGQVTNNNQTLNLQTAMTFDDFMAEAERRGIPLVRQ